MTKPNVRPLNKVIVRPDGRLLLEWDGFFAFLQDTITKIQTAGSFTMAAAASKTIADKRVTAASNIQLQATNAVAAKLQGSANALYVTNLVPSVGFDVHTSTSAAAGTETFTYVILG